MDPQTPEVRLEKDRKILLALLTENSVETGKALTTLAEENAKLKEENVKLSAKLTACEKLFFSPTTTIEGVQRGAKTVGVTDTDQDQEGWSPSKSLRKRSNSMPLLFSKYDEKPFKPVVDPLVVNLAEVFDDAESKDSNPESTLESSVTISRDEAVRVEAQCEDVKKSTHLSTAGVPPPAFSALDEAVPVPAFATPDKDDPAPAFTTPEEAAPAPAFTTPEKTTSASHVQKPKRVQSLPNLRLKKDGTPDYRYRENERFLRKNGTPDMRYTINRPLQYRHLRMDRVTPDKRFKVNRATTSVGHSGKFCASSRPRRRLAFV